jgi:hypothetical protein
MSSFHQFVPSDDPTSAKELENPRFVGQKPGSVNLRYRNPSGHILGVDLEGPESYWTNLYVVQLYSRVSADTPEIDKARTTNCTRFGISYINVQR